FDLLKSRFESPEFLQEFHEIQKSVFQNGAVELDKSWDVIKAGDVWEDDDDNGYVLVKPEDAAEGIAFFVATYLSTLTKTKELSPDRLQKGLLSLFFVHQNDYLNHFNERSHAELHHRSSASP
uniref:Uncharacterized protein n=1 Tax=Aegilops tauschii subsp. strangulata TaxID=200361 RepID=A0A453L0Q4_AEGTS